MVIPDMTGVPGRHKDFAWRGELFEALPMNRKRGPITHILDTGAYWHDKELGVDNTEDFITAALPFFEEAGAPMLQHGDTIIGKDKNGTMVTIKIVKIPDDPQKNEQKAPL